MKQVLEELFGYGLNRSKHAEIRVHIRNKTYKSIDEFDSDLNIINMNNGLYNIQTGKLMPHTSDYISLNKKPIVYDPNVPIPSQFITFLRQIVYPSDLRTVLELMAYTFHRANPFEILTMLFGIGGNGKGVLFGVIEGLHGAANISNVSLKTIIERPFGLYDLVGKDVNLDNELSSTTIYDSAILKKITGRQPTRVEQKNQKAFDARLHAKLWFSANKIPDTVDDTNAFFRRVIIVATPNTFSESTPGYDPYLIDKLTTPESLAGIFNLLAPMLRRILANRRIYLSDKTIEDRRAKYETAVNPVGVFIDIAILEESLPTDTISKTILYEAYKHFCKKRKLAPMLIEAFGKRLTKEGRFESYREMRKGKRHYSWLGIRLTEEYEKAVNGFYGSQTNLEDLSLDFFFTNFLYRNCFYSFLVIFTRTHLLKFA